MENSRWVLGVDKDGELFSGLLTTLKKFGFIVDPQWLPKDSSSLDTFPMRCPDGSILVEAVTPDGLVVSGPGALVRAIRQSHDAES